MKAPEQAPRIVYVERLTLAWLCKNAERSNPFKVFYLDHDSLALLLARWLARICPVEFQELRFRSEEAVDKDGVSVRLKSSYQELAVVADLIGREIPVSIQEDKRVALYLMKAPVSLIDLYSVDRYHYLGQAVLLVNFIRWHADKMDASKQPLEIHLFHRPFFQDLAAYTQSKGCKLCSMKAYRSWKSPWRKTAKKMAKLNGRFIQAFFRHALSAVFRSKEHRPENPPHRPAKLLIESRLDFNIKNPQLVSDLFFLENREGIQGEDVLLVFNGSFNPVDEEKYEGLRQAGIEAVALSPQSSLVSPSKVPVFSRKMIDTHLDQYQRVDGVREDLRRYLTEFARARSYWEDFFKSNNIKLWATFFKNEPQHIAMASALTALGGVSAMYQRSYEPNTSIITASGTDIIFSFSTTSYEMEMKNGSDFRYHVATGYLGDYRFGHLRPGAAKLRERLTQAGARHVIAYFDENTIDDGRWFYGHHFARENYSYWLEKLFADPSLGLIFKPKIPKTLRRRLGEVSTLLTKAQETGRCYVFEGGEPQSSFPPAAASLACDIAIHEDLAAGTAGLESALAGTKTILMDFEGWPKSPLYQLGDEVVFKDWDSVWKACAQYFKDPSSRPRLGDWSAMINELDPFHDGLASHRVNGYLKDLLDGLRRSEDPVLVMERAAQMYERRWGKDKVRRGPRR